MSPCHCLWPPRGSRVLVWGVPMCGARTHSSNPPNRDSCKARSVPCPQSPGFQFRASGLQSSCHILIRDRHVYRHAGVALLWGTSLPFRAWLPGTFLSREEDRGAFFTLVLSFQPAPHPASPRACLPQDSRVLSSGCWQGVWGPGLVTPGAGRRCPGSGTPAGPGRSAWQPAWGPAQLRSSATRPQASDLLGATYPVKYSVFHLSTGKQESLSLY